MAYTYTNAYIDFTLSEFITNVNLSSNGTARSERRTTSTINKFDVDHLKLFELNNFSYNLYEYLLTNTKLYDIDHPLPPDLAGYYSNLLSISSKFDCEHRIYMSQDVYNQWLTSGVYSLVFVINRCLTQDVYKYTSSTFYLYDNHNVLFNEVIMRRDSNDNITVEFVTPKPPSADVLMAVQRGLSYAMENYELQYFNRTNQRSLAYENFSQQYTAQIKTGPSPVKIITGITS